MSRNHIFFILCLISIYWCQTVLAYDDELTHRQLTDFATQKSILKTNKYLSNNLGDKFADEYGTIIGGKQIIEWLQDGSKLEDSPNCRAASHFLNPLKPWDEAGLSDTNEMILGAFVVNPGCFIGAPFSDKYSIHKYSNVTWATAYSSPTDDWTLTGNNADWNSARSYYSLALTERDKDLRETYFANMFQSMGQVMHLIQDMAVPAHVRNDFSAHLVFQKASLNWPNKWMGNTYEWFVKDPVNAGLISDAMANSEGIDPSDALLTSFWDANKYDGSNPSTTMAQGLSEYTNGNFFSESTIFAEEKDTSDIHYFPQPAKNGTYAKLVEVLAYDGQTDNIRYVSKVGSNDKLAAYSYLQKWVETTNAGSSPWAPFEKIKKEGWEYNLDDEVYKDYAKNLLPRAVGYSAGLINYFFRGEIDMVKDDANPGKYIIENHSLEAMDKGRCTLYYDDENDNRIAVTDASWSCNIPANGKKPDPVSFTAPTDPKPKKKGEYMLVFEGKLGNEEGSVIGKVVELNDNSWSYLLIKQTDFSTDAITYIEEYLGSESAEITETWINKHAGGHHTSSVKFDLEWLGDGADIINVTFMKYSNYYCYDYSKTIIADLNNTNGHSINLVKPTKNTKGFVEFIYNGSENYTTPYPKYILVEAVDQQGKNIKFFEPIFVIASSQKTYEEIMHASSKYEYVYNTGRDARVSVDARPHNIRCMAKLTGRSSLGAYEIDKSGWSNYRERDDSYPNTSGSFVDISSQRFEIGVGEFNHTTNTMLREDAKEVSVSLPDVTVKINRTWSSNAVTYLESLGYSGIELPEWQLTLNGGI